MKAIRMPLKPWPYAHVLVTALWRISGQLQPGMLYHGTTDVQKDIPVCSTIYVEEGGATQVFWTYRMKNRPFN